MLILIKHTWKKIFFYKKLEICHLYFGSQTMNELLSFQNKNKNNQPIGVPTTGKMSFAQSRDFCREQKRGISAKKPFAERRSRQTRAVGNSQDCRGPASRQTTTLGEVGHFAESPARQKMTFGKMGLCRGPHSRQNQALGKTLPWAHRRDLP